LFEIVAQFGDRISRVLPTSFVDGREVHSKVKGGTKSWPQTHALEGDGREVHQAAVEYPWSGWVSALPFSLGQEN
jgi:hypothetical protein